MTITDEELERIYEAWRTRPDYDLICYLPDLIAALREARRERDALLSEASYCNHVRRAEAAEAEVARLREELGRFKALHYAVFQALPLLPSGIIKVGTWRMVVEAFDACGVPHAP